MTLRNIFDLLGSEIEDADEETFLLYSQDIPSQNLGFVDSHAATLDLNIAGKEYTIHQSPTILNQPGSTTGSILWKISPAVASWLSSPDNLLWTTKALSSSSSILELGCGTAGLVGLAVSPHVSRYVLTDQPYVARLVEKNLEENLVSPQKSPSHKRKGKLPSVSTSKATNLCFKPLDWELDRVTSSLTGSSTVTSFDAVIACDCIYNEALIKPLVQTCADVCGLRGADEGSRPTICLVAQQLRLPEIFESWIKEFSQKFRVWRLPDETLSEELRANKGFVVHIGVLKDAMNN